MRIALNLALNLKGLQADMLPVHLINNGGEQFSAAYAALNPQQLVPLLDDEGMLLSQSLAIIVYLDETHPQVPLLPQDPATSIPSTTCA
ncbi:MAG: hypothetical protein V7631_2481 [Massilia sp.]